MLLKPNPEVGDQGEKTVKAKEQEVMGVAMAETDTEADQLRFTQKMGSVFPKKRRSLIVQMFGRFRKGLRSTSADHTSQVENNTAASSAALFPEETNAAFKA